MVEIKLENRKAHLNCSVATLVKLRNLLRLRVPGAWYAPSYRNRSWDGFAHYITQAGYFQLGLLPKIIEHLKNLDESFEIVDLRDEVKPKKIVTKFGKIELRGYQLEAVESLFYNKVENITFQRGILDEATNAGKTLIAASIFKSYPDHVKMVFVVNRQHLYIQLKKELAELLGNKDIGWVGPDGKKANRLMVVMVQSLVKNPQMLALMADFNICIVDEAHYSSSSSYQHVLSKLEDCSVRVGLSGTPFKHKDKNKNQKILSFFGPTLHATTNKDLIDLGFSTPPIVTISQGNTEVRYPGDYKAEETEGLIKSKERNKAVLRRCKLHVNKGRYPILVVAKYHNHTELLYRKVKKAFPELKVNYIHVKVKNRLQILKDFKEGKIDILVSSKLIKEGQNLPLIKSLVMACGGDSLIDLLQIVGRALRKHKSKKKVYIDDFYDKGTYLERHSKHRVKELKKQQFKVIENYGKKKKAK